MPLNIPAGQGLAPNIVAIQDIGAGANLKASRFTIPLNQMVLLQNFYLLEDGSLLGRRGTLRWNAASLGTGATLGATRAYFAGANHFLAAHNGTIYKGDDGTKTFASSLTGLNATSPVWFWQYLNFVYASNKIDTPRKWNGTAWSVMGITAPSAACAAAVGGAGTPNGTYTVKYTYVTDTIESNPSPASGSVAVVNQQINLTGVTVGPAGTVKRKIYAFKTGVSTVYQLVGEIADNVTTTFTITTDQPSWTTTVTSQNDPPPVGPWLMTVYKNRVWKSGDPTLTRRVWFSQVFVPEANPTSYYVDIPLSFGDQVTALFVLGDMLLVFGHVEVYYIVGDSPFSFVVRRSFAPRGTPSPWAVTRVENTALYLSRFALMTFDGAQGRITSDQIEPHFTGVFQSIQAINYAAADRAGVQYYDRLKAVAVTFPIGSSADNNLTWWYFLRRQGWAQDTRSARLFLTTDGFGDSGDLFAFDVDAGILRQWDPSGLYTDDGTAITGRLKTGVLVGDHPLATKSWDWFTARARPANVTLQVTVELDQGAESDTLALNLARGAVLGVAQVGVAMLGADFDDFEERLDGKMRGRGVALDVTAQFSEFLQIGQFYLTETTMPVVRRRVGV